MAAAARIVGLLALALACVSAANAEGVELVERGEYAAALPLLERELASAREAGDAARASNLLFYMGLSEQRLAEQSGGEAREAALRRAAGHYEAMLELRESGAGLNNLAQLYVELGRDADVGQLYQDAFEQNDGRKSFYATRYAGFLEERGQLPAAITWAQRAVEAYPDDADAQRTLMHLYLQKDRGAAVRHAVSQFQAARFELARSLALQAVAAGSWEPKPLATLRTLVARTLLYSGYARADFPGSELGRKLADSGDAELGALVALHEDRRRPGRSPYEWWLGQDEPAMGGVSPREALLALVVFLGDWHRSLGGPQELRVAEAYYLHGLDLSGRRIDAGAVVSLVRLYFEQGRLEDIAEVSQRYGRLLYQSKEKAYARGDLEEIYRLHMALGTMYAHLGIWTSGIRYANAIFQLEHARKAASEYNRDPLPGGPARLSVPPQALELLAQGYAATRGREAADAFRLEVAGEFLESNDDWAAGVVLAGVAPAELNPVQSERYQQMRSTIPEKFLMQANP